MRIDRQDIFHYDRFVVFLYNMTTTYCFKEVLLLWLLQ